MTGARVTGAGARAMTLLEGMVAVTGRPYPGEVSEGTDCARLCASVKLWTLNSVIDKELENESEGRGQRQHKLCLAVALSL